MARLGPTTLSGKHIRLEPMRASHLAGLREAARAEEIWEWMPLQPRTEDAIEGWLDAALTAEAQGREYPFVVIRRPDERLIGSSRYLEVQENDRTVEIGWTWYTPDSWGTAVNPEAKYLMMRHAFEDWRAIRVALKTDVRNLHSQAAIRKLGAVYEGTMRNQRIRPDGSYRDTVLYSVIEAEWPAVKLGLERRIG